jgi:prepilin-type N-terminal cleavage/methylation domain-containing protein
MKTQPTANLFRRAFTLIEVLAAVTIIGILVFLAIPNITAVRRDSEENMATAKASMLNMGLASYIQAVGITYAKKEFATIAAGTAADKNQARYLLVRPYLAYAPATLTEYMPGGYAATIPASLEPLTRTTLFRPNTTEIQY